MTMGFFGAAAAIFGGVLSTLFVVTVAIFLSLEERAIERSLLVLFPKRYENFVLNIWHKSQKKISGWFLSRIISCVFVGVLSYFSFLIINTKYPLSLGISAGFLNFIPFIGPVVTGILIILLVSLDSMSKAIIALIAFILIQQIENNILTPILTKKFVDLSPVLVLVSIAVGGKLLGFWGAILAIPFAGILVEFAGDYLKKKREEEAAVL
jgi:predicted PurR-regulated permease PerM